MVTMHNVNATVSDKKYQITIIVTHDKQTLLVAASTAWNEQNGNSFQSEFRLPAQFRHECVNHHNVKSEEHSNQHTGHTTQHSQITHTQTWTQRTH